MTIINITQNSVIHQTPKSPQKKQSSSNANTIVALPVEPVPPGLAIPPNVPHAISGSWPTWKDAVSYSSQESGDVMKVGYPRFAIHPSIQKLSAVFEQHLGCDREGSLLFPSSNAARLGRDFIIAESIKIGTPLPARVVQISITKEGDLVTIIDCPDISSNQSFSGIIHAVLYPAHAYQLAKLFWTLPGMGISSRRAQFWLSLLSKNAASWTRFGLEAVPNLVGSSWQSDQPCFDSVQGKLAKRAIRNRIAELLRHGRPAATSSEDVLLYPTGMCAIWNAHNVASKAHPTAKSVCFGFSYTCTMHLLQKWSPGCYFFGHGSESDFNEVENILKDGLVTSSHTPPVFAIFAEIPSNPLLRTPDLLRLRGLADKCGVPLILDDTLSNLVNLDVLPYADILATSLTKIFSGASNVMGGSLILNPAGQHYQKLKQELNATYEDIYFDEDAICMEYNSRDVVSRVRVTNDNAEAVCDFLRSRSIAGGASSAVIKEVFYPKWTTREMYDSYRTTLNGDFVGGFGTLCSVSFINAPAAHAFYDSLACYKGPSLGTNFTLSCPYTVIGHWDEMEWAARYGVEENLVRISVGMENREALLKCVEFALNAAEETST
ncbi:hypothetical protein HWV62_35164 [Athelia sp. TMB]|nr:hypothetical protein HWV62_35164 [Athelia sp. TMB]